MISEGFKNLAPLITAQKFSPGNGVKIAVGRQNDEKAKIQVSEHANFYALRGAEFSDDLGQKTTTAQSPTPTEKSKTPSNLPSNPPVGPTSPSPPYSSDDSGIILNKGFLIICGLVVLGIIFFLANTCKKKAEDFPDVAPLPDQPAKIILPESTDASKTTPGSDNLEQGVEKPAEEKSIEKPVEDSSEHPEDQ